MEVLVNRENPKLDQSPSAPVFPRLEDAVILDHDDQQAGSKRDCIALESMGKED